MIPLGAKVRGWLQMETVTIGCEFRCLLNNLPLEFRRPAREDRRPRANAEPSA